MGNSDSDLEKKYLKILMENQARNDWVFIKEGLITSYGSDYLINVLKNNFSDKVKEYGYPKQRFEKTKYGTPRTIVMLVDHLTDSEKRKFYNFCDIYGYIIVSEKFLTTRNQYHFTIEQKYPPEITADDIKHPIIHVAPPESADKIRKYGLIPKVSRSSLNHTNNVYLLIIRDFTIVPNIIKMIVKNRNEKLGKEKYTTENWVCFEIKLPSDKILYFDNSFMDIDTVNPRFYSVYSKEPISKNYITEIPL